MTDTVRPHGAAPPAHLPLPPYDVAVLGAGRVGGSLAEALTAAGHRIVGLLGRDDDPSPIARATVVLLAVPDDALAEAAGVVARLARPGTVVSHACGIAGLEPLADCGPLIAAIHPAVPIASRDVSFAGVPFGVTCPNDLEDWCRGFVEDLGGRCFFIPAEQRVLYHAALAMASNFAVALAGDAADLAGSHELLVPLLRATVENIAALGPDAALTGPIARGDVGTVRAHLIALPSHLLEGYVANARRTVARAEASGRITVAQARALLDALEEALVR